MPQKQEPVKTFQSGTDGIAISEKVVDGRKTTVATLLGRNCWKDEWKRTHNYSTITLAQHIANCQEALNWMKDRASSPQTAQGGNRH